jgi:hypothetical protein
MQLWVRVQAASSPTAIKIEFIKQIINGYGHYLVDLTLEKPRALRRRACPHRKHFELVEAMQCSVFTRYVT